jgi:hypothetical protein
LPERTRSKRGRFEVADGSTVFRDENQRNDPGPMQVMLLRVFEGARGPVRGSTCEISTEPARQRCNKPWLGQSRPRESLTMNGEVRQTKAAEFLASPTGYTIECRSKVFPQESSSLGQLS